jgi:hypothetical protein
VEESLAPLDGLAGLPELNVRVDFVLQDFYSLKAKISLLRLARVRLTLIDCYTVSFIFITPTYSICSN